MILEVKGVALAEDQRKCFLQPGGKAYLAFKKSGKRYPVYKVKKCN